MRLMGTTQGYVTVPEASELLGMDGGDVYVLIFQGELEALPTLEHGVLVPVEAVERLRRHRDADSTR